MNDIATKQLLDAAHSLGIITEWPPYLTREKINDACLAYGAEGVIWYLRREWRPDKPTINYCWVISEIALRLIMPPGTKCFRVDVTGKGRYHWFLRDPKGRIVDLTLDQAEGWWEIPKYSDGKVYHFKPAISDRGKKLAQFLGILDEKGKGRR